MMDLTKVLEIDHNRQNMVTEAWELAISLEVTEMVVVAGDGGVGAHRGNTI